MRVVGEVRGDRVAGRRRSGPPRTAPGRRPAAMPPCCWPSTSSGLSTVPQSSTATWRRRRDLAGVGVDLDDGDVGAERERGAVLVEVELLGERACRRLGERAARGQLGPRQRRGRHAGDADRARASCRRRCRPTSASSSRRGQAAWPGRPSPRWPEHRRAAELQRARPAGAAAARTRSVSPSTRRIRSTGMPVRVGHDHGERRLVALPVRRACRRITVAEPSACDLDRAELVGAAAGGDLDVGGDADAEQDPVAARHGAAACSARKRLVADRVGGAVERERVAAGVVGDAA